MYKKGYTCCLTFRGNSLIVYTLDVFETFGYYDTYS